MPADGCWAAACARIWVRRRRGRARGSGREALCDARFLHHVLESRHLPPAVGAESAILPGGGSGQGEARRVVCWLILKPLRWNVDNESLDKKGRDRQ